MCQRLAFLPVSRAGTKNFILFDNVCILSISGSVLRVFNDSLLYNWYITLCFHHVKLLQNCIYLFRYRGKITVNIRLILYVVYRLHYIS